MLEEPRTHYIGGMLGQDSSFVLGLLILIVQEGGEVKVNLQSTWREKQRQQPGGQQLGTRCYSDSRRSLLTPSQLILRARALHLSCQPTPVSQRMGEGKKEVGVGERGERGWREQGHEEGMERQICKKPPHSY